MHGLAPYHTSQRTKTFIECNGIPVLKWPGNSPEMNSIENVWNIMTKEGCLKEEMWKRASES